MTIKHLFPDARPTFNLDFANELALDPRITFSRSSIGTYVDKNGVIQTAQNDEPRFDYDGGTGESLGLLIEESRVNSITQSQALDTAPWFPINGAIASSPELSPEGAANAYRLTASASNCYNRYIITNSGSSYTFSAFIKAGNVNWARLYAFGGYVDFDLQNAVPGFVSAAITDYGVDSLDNGWVRCWAVTANTAVTQVRISPLIDSNDASTSPGDYIDIYGVQLELGGFPTSLIPTAGTTETRAADVASITGTNFSSWYNQSEGTMFVEAKAVNVGANQQFIHTYGASGTNNRGMYYLNGNNRPSVYWVNAGAAQALLQSNTPAAGFEGQPFKYAAAYSTDDFVLGYNGGNLIFDTEGTPDPTIDRASIGSFSAGSSFLNGHISRLSYYSLRLSDEQLKALTS